ncbi:MAG TPA: pitrilysin family protein [Pyrinomonadaceae bacterium]|jgi:zinc protease|nr:pitrilysin family protein [Pyrinomonadaceae bacterium]
MLLKRSLAGILTGLLLAASALAQSTKLPPINVKEYKLKNGMTVVLHQDHSTPIVSVNMFYHVGSKNETPGRTGFAHLFEHMMFQGSGNFIDGWRAVDEMGGSVNGTTDQDRTFYYETVPSNMLERTLYMEADRMGNLLAAMDQAKLDNQRDVVKNERRFRVDNVPYGGMSERTLEVMYPEGHPYRWDVIGSMSDLSAASLEDVKSFFRTYYVPNNTVMAISGDFTEKQATAWIQKYFGGMKAGKAIVRPNIAEPQLSSIVRQTYEDPFANLPRIQLTWVSVPQYSEDEAPLDILASVLSSGRGSRLQSNLVYKNELVGNVFASNGTSEIAGLFQIAATARGGKSTEEIEKEINIEIERLKRDGVTADEVNRAITGREVQAIYGLQTVFGKGSTLAQYAGYLGKPDYFQTNLDRYRKVTPDEVKRVANKYLIANHMVLTAVPAKTPPPPAKTDKPASTESKKKDTALIAKQEAMLPKVGPDPKFTLPAIEKSKLSNGLNVWIVQHHELPIVSMNLVINGGGMMENADKAGVASMTASMLNQGTKTRSAVDISNGLQSIGATVGAGASFDSTTVQMQTITKNLDAALGYFADEVMNPSFPDNEFKSLKGRSLNGLRARKASNTAVAGVVYDKVLYGTQAYGRQLSGDEKTVAGMSRDDVSRFYETYYRPNNSTLIVVGDVQPADIKDRLEKAFANWKSGDVKATSWDAQQMMAKPAIYVVDKPGAAQSSINIGLVGIERSNPDYYAVQVMNSILGGGGTARLYMNLREDKGYTYGAYSRFTYRKGAGPFSAYGEIQTVSTKEAVQEFLKELAGIRNGRPITQQELDTNKQSFIRRFPSGFETVGGISGQLANLVTYSLPDTYFNDYISKVNAVTIDDVNRVANKYLDPSKMAVVIVGDRKVIEPGLKELSMPIVVLDVDGNPITQ